MFTMGCDHNGEPIALVTNTKKSKRKTNRHKVNRNGNTLCEPPNTRPNKVPTSIDLKRSTVLSISSKIRVLHSRQINHIRQALFFRKSFDGR